MENGTWETLTGGKGMERAIISIYLRLLPSFYGHRTRPSVHRIEIGIPTVRFYLIIYQCALYASLTRTKRTYLSEESEVSRLRCLANY
jgi:hypothetical protein